MHGGRPTVELWTEAVAGGGAVSHVGITWPNGHYSQWSGAAGPVDVVGFEVRDAFDGVKFLFADAPTVAGRTSTDKLSPEQAKHRITFSWQALKNAEPKDRPKGWRYDAPYAAQHAWWERIGKDKRTHFKVRYAAIADNAPAGMSDDEKNRWWSLELSKKQRAKFKDPYESSFFEDVGEVFEDVAPILTEYVAPQALNLIAPGAGVAATAAIQAAKHVAPVAKAATKIASKAAPKSKKKKATPATSPAPSRDTQTVAKARALATVTKALKSPATRAALERVGVPPEATDRAAAMFDGYRNAAAAIANQKQGNHAAAMAYAKAAEANAKAANLPPATVREGAQRLFYLALTPGGG